MRVLIVSQKISGSDMAPVTAERIQKLLTPQNWEVAVSWNSACAQLIDDIRADDSEPRRRVPLPNMTRWIGGPQPWWREWVSDYLPARGWLFRTMEFVNPLFAWFWISLWPKATDANVTGLFHVLMRCGCDSAAVLSAATSTGHIVFQFAAVAASFNSCADDGVDEDEYGEDDDDEDEDEDAKVENPQKRAFNLLMKQPNLPLFSNAAGTVRVDVVDDDRGPYCCALCTVMHNRMDSASAEVISLMTPAQRLVSLSAPHYAFARACAQRCPSVFKMLWGTVRDHVKHPDCLPSEVDQIIGGPCEMDGRRWSAFFGAVAWGDVSIWRLVMNGKCPLATLLQRHANEHPERQYQSPLSLMTSSDYLDDEVDLRAAQLVPLLCADLLNAYDKYGYTPVMNAVVRPCPKTLAALLDRGVEVDLTAQEIDRGTNSHVAVDALARADTKFTGRTAASFPTRHEVFSVDFRHIVCRLRTETRAQLALRPLIAAVVVPALHQSGGAQMPRELIRLCLTYAGLPEPAATSAPFSRVCVGAKRDVASVNGESSGASAAVASRGKIGPNLKRVRLT